MEIFQGFPPQVAYVLGDTVEGIIVRSYIPCSSKLSFLNFDNEVLNDDRQASSHSIALATDFQIL